MKIALCQTTVHKDWHKNLRNAERVIADAVKSKADMVVLPEMFICPYNKKAISAAAQPEGGEAWQAMSETAAKYRKMHMFDIDVEGGQYYSESSVITAGDEVCVVKTEFGPIGVAICYDVRFPELFRLLAKRGAKAVVMPASFNRTTGPAHWELLMRARALDQEMYVLGCAAAGDLAGSYNGWGHSIAVDPWGSIMEELGEGPGMLMAAVDFAKEDAVRSQIPVLQQLRTDIYEVCEKTVG